MTSNPMDLKAARGAPSVGCVATAGLMKELCDFQRNGVWSSMGRVRARADALTRGMDGTKLQGSMRRRTAMMERQPLAKRDDHDVMDHGCAALVAR